MPFIPLSQAANTIVDVVDFDRFGGLKWYLSYYGYAVRNEGEGTNGIVYLHRAILEAPDGVDVDHASGDKLDNRRENIRLCSRGQNLANRRKYWKNPTSKFKGVGIHTQSGKWRARVAERHLGLFDTELEAAIAYDKAAISMFGEFARLNIQP